jgi:hypothetical protein
VRTDNLATEDAPVETLLNFTRDVAPTIRDLRLRLEWHQ